MNRKLSAVANALVTLLTAVAGRAAMVGLPGETIANGDEP